MIVYKIKNNSVSKVEVSELSEGTMDLSKPDSEGDIVYQNTHFESIEKAYSEAITNCQAGVNLLNMIINGKKIELVKDEEMLKGEMVDLGKLKEELKNHKSIQNN